MSEYYLTKDDLYHHGIKGQRWGIRRFQNPDGSYTAEGRRHYGYKEAKAAYKKRLSDADTAWKKKSDALEEKYWRRNNKLEVEGVKKGYINTKDFDNLDDWWDKEQKKLNADRDLEKKNAKSDFKNSDEYKDRQAKLKKAAVIGAAAVGTALAAYGGYKLKKLYDAKQLKAFQKIAEENVNKIYEPVDKQIRKIESLTKDLVNEHNQTADMLNKYLKKNAVKKIDIPTTTVNRVPIERVPINTVKVSTINDGEKLLNMAIRGLDKDLTRIKYDAENFKKYNDTLFRLEAMLLSDPSNAEIRKQINEISSKIFG